MAARAWQADWKGEAPDGVNLIPARPAPSRNEPGKGRIGSERINRNSQIKHALNDYSIIIP